MNGTKGTETKRAQFTPGQVGAGAARAAIQFAQREIHRAVTLPAGVSPGAFEAKLEAALAWVDGAEAREVALRSACQLALSVIRGSAATSYGDRNELTRDGRDEWVDAIDALAAIEVSR